MMARNPTQLIIEGLIRDPGVLRDARWRLTLKDEPAGARDRLARAICREARSYVAIRNERTVRTDARLSRLRRELVEWAAQYAPPAVGGYQPLLTWSLRQADWTAVVRAVAVAPEPYARRSIMTASPAG
jgi:hypothetical protein